MGFNEFDILNALKILDNLEEKKNIKDIDLPNAFILSLVSVCCHVMPEEECLTLISNAWETLKKSQKDLKKCQTKKS